MGPHASAAAIAAAAAGIRGAFCQHGLFHAFSGVGGTSRGEVGKKPQRVLRVATLFCWFAHWFHGKNPILVHKMVLTDRTDSNDQHIVVPAVARESKVFDPILATASSCFGLTYENTAPTGSSQRLGWLSFGVFLFGFFTTKTFHPGSGWCKIPNSKS